MLSQMSALMILTYETVKKLSVKTQSNTLEHACRLPCCLSTYYFGSFGSLFLKSWKSAFFAVVANYSPSHRRRRSRMQHTLGLLWTLFVDLLSLLTFESLVDLLILYVIYRLGHWLCMSFFNFSNPAPHCSLSCWLFTPLRLSLLRTSCTFCNPKLIFPTPLTLTSDIAYRQPTRERKRGMM